MALKPILKNKVDELFLHWLSEVETQQSLKENLRQLIHGEAISQPTLTHLTSPRGSKSPRMRPTSPPFGGANSKLLSPRSPRRPLANKNNHRSLNVNGNATKTRDVIHSKEAKDVISRDLAEKDNLKNRDKENKELSPTLSTATPTITVTDINKENKRKDHIRPRHINSASIPKFHFPFGKPKTNEENEKLLQQVSAEFQKADGGKIYKHQMTELIKICKLPLYWKSMVFRAGGGDKNSFITYSSFSSMWKKVFQTCHDQPAQFVKLLAAPSTNYLVENDLLPLIQDVVDTHPGLTFLQEAPEFHSRYINTVISRIFYVVNRSWSGRITIPELRKSNFLQTLMRLEDEEDINQITDFFSYEHFYVIYCKFWELDKDHDLFIDKNDLQRHNDHAVSTRVIDRIFSGCVTRGSTFKEGRMSYPEFVWFLLSEEDKRHPTSIEYWFRCMDLDGDGVVSMYEMEYFYDEQVQKMEELGIEKLPFEDCLCQMLDLVGPKQQGKVTLADLKNCKMTNIFFDTFFNLDKFLEHEQRDPFSNVRDLDSDMPEPTDWEKYAAEEYENLVAEEGANEEVLYEDDFEPDEDEIIQKERANLTETMQRNSPVLKNRNGGGNSAEEDIYDFSKSDLGY